MPEYLEFISFFQPRNLIRNTIVSSSPMGPERSVPHGVGGSRDIGDQAHCRGVDNRLPVQREPASKTNPKRKKKKKNRKVTSYSFFKKMLENSIFSVQFSFFFINNKGLKGKMIAKKGSIIQKKLPLIIIMRSCTCVFTLTNDHQLTHPHSHARTHGHQITHSLT